jgi:transketolase
MERLSSTEKLKTKADIIRKRLVEVAIRNGAGHIAPSLSSVDILTALYYRVMNISDSPDWENRDRLVFSKAHGAYGLYAILADIGYIQQKDWDTFYAGSFLAGCIERSPEHGIEASCGALGHGLPIATGIAFGAKLQKKEYMTYCIVGDGEMQEGSNWEAVQLGVKHQLDNLIIIVDCNGLQAMDFLADVLSTENPMDDLESKFTAFGTTVVRCDGHDTDSIINALNRQKNNNPLTILAKTVKGYGIRAMENDPKFHFRIPTVKELEQGVRYE